MSYFKLSWKNYPLTLQQPFTISRGSKEIVNNVLVELRKDGVVGYGEAGPNKRYDEDADKVRDYLQTIPEDFFADIQSVEELVARLDKHSQTVSPIRSAQAAVEMAWLDWLGKSRGQPLWKMWNAPKSTGPVTSYTIGLDDLDVMQQKVKKAADFPIYKVKLGTSRDREIIHALREVTDKLIRVDANEGWTSLSKAREMIDFLSDKNIELVEQPMPAAQVDNLKILKQNAPLPICADESFLGDESVKETAEAFDIINIKLMKTGSLYKAKNIIDRARELDLKVMIGCMIESSVANAAGALLSLWADYCDLDGHLLIKNDPAGGLSLTDEKRVRLSGKPGMGVYLR